ncbi:TetR/AcrR family transcriptional regulator [Streptomyces albipurpureus]|uniref:TetR/AcrR family transcriptional regulator n=1 Tax=Streptomyces albipurpureus TaxID=2897419 RepID=A0ABT0UYH2_9ACTN|nr:TetR/AcrR family transcriptional regulator [Streptomyces sp. CWNU-1]MCM2393525.1 TetR/AcrR family transcriptional regulator [Streptomyces sp. CWNU-1]
MATVYVKADTRRRQLVTAARRVLARQGLAGGTLRAVAAEAGVALGTVHYAFPSKEQLLRAVLEDVVEDISTVLREASQASTDLESGILSAARTVWSTVIRSEPDEHLMQYELSIWALRTAGMAELARWQYDRYLDLITTHWQRVAARVGVTLSVPAEQLARLQLAGTDGLLLQYLVSHDARRSTADQETLIRQLVRYADPQPVAREQ